MAGHKVMCRVAIVVLAPTLGKHIFLLRFQHRKLADLGEVMREAGFSIENRKGSCTGHYDALQWFRPPIAAGQAASALLKPPWLRCSASHLTQVQHTPYYKRIESEFPVTFPWGQYKRLERLTFLYASASFWHGHMGSQNRQIVRKLAGPLQNLARARVLQSQQIGVKRLPVERFQRRAALYAQRRRLGLEMRAIDQNPPSADAGYAPDARGSGASARSRVGKPSRVAIGLPWRSGNSCSTSQWVTASRPPSRTAIFSRAWGCRSIGASTVPRGRFGIPQAKAI